mmetsp:Transcript_11388/g.23292  ORF Transcript_11388/g.23292 Transcript_11388/m.23292 type:complete len:266 (+) Transcript_11388:482-1279(+)
MDDPLEGPPHLPHLLEIVAKPPLHGLELQTLELLVLSILNREHLLKRPLGEPNVIKVGPLPVAVGRFDVLSALELSLVAEHSQHLLHSNLLLLAEFVPMRSAELLPLLKALQDHFPARKFHRHSHFVPNREQSLNLVIKLLCFSNNFALDPKPDSLVNGFPQLVCILKHCVLVTHASKHLDPLNGRVPVKKLLQQLLGVFRFWLVHHVPSLGHLEDPPQFFNIILLDGKQYFRLEILLVINLAKNTVGSLDQVLDPPIYGGQLLR